MAEEKKEFDGLTDQIVALMDSVGDIRDVNFQFTADQKEMIRKLAEKLQGSKALQMNRGLAENYLELHTPQEMYMDMCLKIIEAPTQIHRICVPRMIIPLIWKKLQEDEGRENDSEGV